MTAQVVRLNRTNFHDFIEQITKAYDEKKLDDFICVCSIKSPKGKEEDVVGEIARYWFSGENGSDIHSLGLLEVMKSEILEYFYSMQGK